MREERGERREERGERREERGERREERGERREEREYRHRRRREYKIALVSAVYMCAYINNYTFLVSEYEE